MTFTISLQAWQDLQQEVNETAQHDPLDPLDVTWQIPKIVGHEYIRWIELRRGLELETKLPTRAGGSTVDNGANDSIRSDDSGRICRPPSLCCGFPQAIWTQP